MKAKLKQEAELNQEAVDNEVFSKAVKVNAVALSAVKSFLEVSKVLGVHRSTIISWRNNISLTDYNKYNQTSVTPEIALKRQMKIIFLIFAYLIVIFFQIVIIIIIFMTQKKWKVLELY